MDVFETIYRSNRWNGVESLSGPGSGLAATSHLPATLRKIVGDFDVRSVLDIGCGDGFWMPDLPGYVGIDVSPTAIAAARARHPDRTYLLADARDDRLPSADLVIIRDAIQHLPLADGQRLIGNVRASGSWLLLASTYVGGDNVDIAPGDAYSPDLEQPPFDLGPANMRFFDGHHYHVHGTDALRDHRKHLGLWRIG